MQQTTPESIPALNPTGITRFGGETLQYNISFLWLDNAASAKVQFSKYKGKYYSTLEASTKGLVGFFTSYGRHYYKTEFEIIDNGKSVRPISFLLKITIGNRVETTRHKFNYVTRKHTWSKFLNDKKIKTESNNIPSKHSFHDILTAFYNVRNSIYGPLTKGNHFIIKTITEKGHDEISVHISSEQDEEFFRIGKGREKKMNYC
jgi:hypothetical protein